MWQFELHGISDLIMSALCLCNTEIQFHIEKWCGSKCCKSEVYSVYYDLNCMLYIYQFTRVKILWNIAYDVYLYCGYSRVILSRATPHNITDSVLDRVDYMEMQNLLLHQKEAKEMLS